MERDTPVRPSGDGQRLGMNQNNAARLAPSTMFSREENWSRLHLQPTAASIRDTVFFEGLSS
jgi:hypothetical protein